ncbi:MAG: fibronectin type III domain-containing protein [Muribaculaceae bacterium]|nr:fibronectin type III domain-containing protein [Muribaculaceae bacterium]
MKRFLPLALSAVMAVSALATETPANSHFQDYKPSKVSVNKQFKTKKKSTRGYDFKPVQKPDAQRAVIRQLAPGESKVLFDEPFNLPEGTEAEPVAITLDGNGCIPASLLGEGNYGFGGNEMYQAGGCLYLGTGGDYGTGTLWTPDFSEMGVYTVTVDVRSASEGGDYFDINFMDLNFNGDQFFSMDYTEITNEWQTITFEVDASVASVAEYGAVIMLFAEMDGVYIRNLNVKVTMPAILPPVALPYTNYTGSSFQANWEPVEGATKYFLNVMELDMATYDVTEFLDVEVEGISYVVEGIKPATVYYYAVKCTNGTEMSGQSQTITVQDMAPAENVSAAAREDYSGVVVSWDPVPGSGVYAVNLYREHSAKADETFMIADADFSGIQSTGTWDNPEVSEYISEVYPQLYGWQFLLPQTIPGAIGIQMDDDYALYGLYASLETFAMDMGDAVDGKVDISMEVATNTESTFAAAVFAWNDEYQSYRLTDAIFDENTLTTDFTKFDYSLSGLSKDCIITIQPYLNFTSSEQLNLYFKSVKASVRLNQGGCVTMILDSKLVEDETKVNFEMDIDKDDAYYITITSYAVDEDGYLLYEGKEGERIHVDNTAGLTTITTPADGPTEYYTLQGVRVANPASGIYIRKQGNTATKVLVK